MTPETVTIKDHGSHGTVSSSIVHEEHDMAIRMVAQSHSGHIMTDSTTSPQRRPFCTMMASTSNDYSDATAHLHHSHAKNTGGSSMYMSGFRFTFSVASTNTINDIPPPPCLNFLHDSFTLDTPWKFFFAAVLTVTLSFVTEALAAFRFKKQGLKKGGGSRQWSATRICGVNSRKFVRVFLHCLHGFMGYLLMMIAMTYSIELLLCVLVGSGLGYAVYFCSDNDGIGENDESSPDVPTGTCSAHAGYKMIAGTDEYTDEEKEVDQSKTN